MPWASRRTRSCWRRPRPTPSWARGSRRCTPTSPRIGAQVSAAVPEPDESYADLSGDRWGGLKEYFDAPAEVARPRRERRWWRVLAPVAALVVLALVVGIVAVFNGWRSGRLGRLGSPTAWRSPPPTAGRPGTELSVRHRRHQGKKNRSRPTPSQKTLRERFRDQLNLFAVVALARAREATGAVQRFAVLRIFKGSAPKVIELAVNGQPRTSGRLHLLMLDPTHRSAG